MFFIPLENFSLILNHHRYRGRAENFGLNSDLLDMLRVLSVSHLVFFRFEFVSLGLDSNLPSYEANIYTGWPTAAASLMSSESGCAKVCKVQLKIKIQLTLHKYRGEKSLRFSKVHYSFCNRDLIINEKITRILSDLCSICAQYRNKTPWLLKQNQNGIPLFKRT